jgi:hypothetical protein
VLFFVVRRQLGSLAPVPVSSPKTSDSVTLRPRLDIVALRDTSVDDATHAQERTAPDELFVELLQLQQLLRQQKAANDHVRAILRSRATAYFKEHPHLMDRFQQDQETHAVAAYQTLAVRLPV